MSHTRRACEEYALIEDGDRVIAAVSGGKDSLAMLAALAKMRDFYPKKYELAAVTVSLGFKGHDLEPVRRYCAKLGVPYIIVETDIADVVFNERKEANPCSLCAKMRKGALNNEALRLGGTKVAYGHNRDDVIHTFLMALLYEGRIHTFAPKTFLSKTGLHAIRPIMYVPERDVVSFVKNACLPVVKSPCPADGHTKREEARRLTAELSQKFGSVETKIFNAVRRSILAREGE